MYNIIIKQIREEKGLTMKKLSEISNVSVGYICHLENGTRTHPSIEVMEKIAKALNKPISEIFFNQQQ